MSGLQRLKALEEWLEREIVLCRHGAGYEKTAHARAYTRVLQRLRPIVKDLKDAERNVRGLGGPLRPAS